MSQLTVVAKFKAKSGSKTAFYQELLQLIASTLAEEGCLNYVRLALLTQKKAKKSSNLA